MGILIRIKEWIKVIQSVFNADVYLLRRHLDFHFLVVFGKQIYLTDRAMESGKMVERFIEISMYFCFRCSKMDSLTERTEESLLLTIFFKVLGFLFNSCRVTFPSFSHH